MATSKITPKGVTVFYSDITVNPDSYNWQAKYSDKIPSGAKAIAAVCTSTGHVVVIKSTTHLAIFAQVWDGSHSVLQAVSGEHNVRIFYTLD